MSAGCLEIHSAGGAASARERSERPLRVLFYLFFPGGGIGRYTHELLKHLGRTEEIEAELACLPSYPWLADAEYATWPQLREIGHATAIRRRARFLVGQVVNPLRLVRRAAERRADVVHLSNINHLTLPLWRAKLAGSGARVAATVHDVRRAKAILNRRYESRQLRRFYESADALFVHSRSQADELMDFASVSQSRVHVVPHGPYDYGATRLSRDEARKKYGWPPDRQIALFFGSVRDDKNLELLLRVLPGFRDRLHLVVAGRGAGRPHKPMEYYRRIVQELDLGGSVSFLDRYIPDAAVPEVFTACDWVALPYSRAFTSQSGVLNVAAQYCRPVLISAAPTLAETIGRCDVGIAVEPESPDALREGIAAIQLRIEQGYAHEFERYRREFGWEENAARTAAVYRALCFGTQERRPR